MILLKTDFVLQICQKPRHITRFIQSENCHIWVYDTHISQVVSFINQVEEMNTYWSVITMTPIQYWHKL